MRPRLVCAWSERHLLLRDRRRLPIHSAEAAAGILVVDALRGCSATGDIDLGERIHADVVQRGQYRDHYVSSTLVSLYSKCGILDRARELLWKLLDSINLDGSVVAWTALIFGYALQGGEKAATGLTLLAFMQLHGVSPNARTFVAALKACSSVLEQETMDRDCVVAKARSIQEQAVSSGFGGDIFLCNTLVDFFSKAGSTVEARRVFFAMPSHTLVSWNALLLGCAENGEELLALEFFSRMQREDGFVPSAWSFVAANKACTALAVHEKLVSYKSIKLEALSKGMELHAQAVMLECDADVFVSSSLVEMYSKCGGLIDSRRIFDRIPCHDVVLWTALVSAYVDNGEPQLALELVTRMSCEPNSRTFVIAVKACSTLASGEDGKLLAGKLVKVVSLDWGLRVHSEAAKRGLDSDWYVASGLADMYAVCGSMVDAHRMFDKIHASLSSGSRKNKIKIGACWNSLILGYVTNDECQLALQLYQEMVTAAEITPDSRTFAAALKACAGLAALETGREVAAAVFRAGAESNAFLSTCLVDFYAKSGSMVCSRQLFDACSSAETDAVAWTALVAGYSRQGDSENARNAFEGMVEAGLSPDSVSFVCLLTACSHAGLVETGKSYFGEMLRKFGMEPGVEHYECVVDLLARSNRLEEAVAVAETMPFKTGGALWMVILAAAKKWENVEIGRVAFQGLLKAVGDDENEIKSTAFLLLSSIPGSPKSLQMFN